MKQERSGFGSKAAALKSEKKRTEKQEWKDEADKWFSEFIRLRDSDHNGIATCITSEYRAHWRDMDAGHYISREIEALRYDEKNCHAQSRLANRFQGGQFKDHGFRIEEKYGRGTCHALRQKATRICRHTTADYKFIAETYKERVMNIKDKEPGKYFRKSL